MNNFFEKHPEIHAVLSEREDGSMKILGDGRNEGNRNDFFDRIGVDPDSIVSADLANGNDVVVVDDAGKRIAEKTDGLVTKNKEISLAITVADCVPVFFFEPEKNIIAIAHAGWRGIVGRIVPKTIEKIKELGGDAQKLKVALGPGINACHFEIKEDVLGEFDEYEEFIIKKESKIFIDLKGIIRKQLESGGVAAGNIENDNECTYESEKYFSYRRDKTEVIEAMIAIVGFKNQ